MTEDTRIIVRACLNRYCSTIFESQHFSNGTLVLFESDKVPHEVLDTNAERVAVVGWYNRPVTAGDIAELSGGDVSPVRLVALAVAAGLVTVGLANLLS